MRAAHEVAHEVAIDRERLAAPAPVISGGAVARAYLPPAAARPRTAPPPRRGRRPSRRRARAPAAEPARHRRNHPSPPISTTDHQPAAAATRSGRSPAAPADPAQLGRRARQPGIARAAAPFGKAADADNRSGGHPADAAGGYACRRIAAHQRNGHRAKKPHPRGGQVQSDLAHRRGCARDAAARRDRTAAAAVPAPAAPVRKGIWPSRSPPRTSSMPASPSRRYRCSPSATSAGSTCRYGRHGPTPPRARIGSGPRPRVDAALDTDAGARRRRSCRRARPSCAHCSPGRSTRQQPLEEIERLQRRAAELSDPTMPRRAPHPTAEVDPDDIEPRSSWLPRRGDRRIRRDRRGQARKPGVTSVMLRADPRRRRARTVCAIALGLVARARRNLETAGHRLRCAAGRRGRDRRRRRGAHDWRAATTSARYELAADPDSIAYARHGTPKRWVSWAKRAAARATARARRPPRSPAIQARGMTSACSGTTPATTGRDRRPVARRAARADDVRPRTRSPRCTGSAASGRMRRASTAACSRRSTRPAARQGRVGARRAGQAVTRAQYSIAWPSPDKTARARSGGRSRSAAAAGAHAPGRRRLRLGRSTSISTRGPVERRSAKRLEPSMIRQVRHLADPALPDARAQPTPTTRSGFAAAARLGVGGAEDAVDTMIEWPTDPDPRIKQAAADVLGLIGGRRRPTR